MASSQSIVLRHATSAEMDRLKPLWNELYRHQSEHGMLLHLPDGAFEAWLNSINPFLGRFAAVVVAEEGNDLVAFVAGRIRTLPPYFGSSNVGTISEVFVRESHRRAGIARRLLDLGIEWFATQEITRVELQVVAGNRAGIEFYRRLGWREELVQFVWDSPRR